MTTLVGKDRRGDHARDDLGVLMEMFGICLLLVNQFITQLSFMLDTLMKEKTENILQKMCKGMALKTISTAAAAADEDHFLLSQVHELIQIIK